MSRLRRFALRPALVGATLVLLAAVPAFTAAASSQQVSPSLARYLAAGNAVAGASHPTGGLSSPGRVYPLRSQATCPTGHFLYVESGFFGGPQQISGYSIGADCSLTPTPGSPYPTGGTQNQTGYGFNTIATSIANGPCVFHADTSGQVESFTVATNGALTKVSSVTVGNGSTIWPSDVHVSADGKFLYVVDAFGFSMSTLSALTVGGGCALTLASTVTANGATYEATALIGSKGLDAVNINGTIDIYSITNGTQLTLVTSTPSQLPSPDGAAAILKSPIGPLVFNGMASFSSETEVHTINAHGVLGNVSGSPASDPSGANSAHVFFDASHGQLIAGEQISNSLGFYGKSGSAYGLLGHSSVATASAPAAMAELGSELYVTGQGGPGVDACVLSLGSAACTGAAMLPGGADPDGLGVL